MNPDQSEVEEVDISNYKAADQDSDGNDGFGDFVQGRAEKKLPPAVANFIADIKLNRLSMQSEVEVPSSGETETRKRSRSTSSLKHETDVQPVKQSRGRSSSRVSANATPSFLHNDERTKLPKSDMEKLNLETDK